MRAATWSCSSPRETPGSGREPRKSYRCSSRKHPCPPTSCARNWRAWTPTSSLPGTPWRRSIGCASCCRGGCQPCCRVLRSAAGALLFPRKTAVRQKLTGLASDAGRDEHAGMAHGQSQVLGRTRHQSLTHCDRPVAVLLELRQNLADPQGLRAGDDPELAVGELPAALVRLQQLIRDGLAHQVGDEADMTGLNRRAAGDRWGAQEHHAPGRLPRETLEKPVDHQPTQAVSDEMQPPRTQLLHQGLQVGDDLWHRGRGSGIAEGADLEPEVIRKPAPKKKRLAAG